MTEQVHKAHCNQGEYVGSCKYGEDDCPAMTENVCEHVWSEGIDRGFVCMKPGCDAWLTMEQAESRLNEYEKLKADLEFMTEASEANSIEIVRLLEIVETHRRATEVLSAEDARALSYSLPGFEDNVLWHYADILEGK